MGKRIFIHYGHDHFDAELFMPIQNKRCSNRPFGGLWASDESSAFGWKNWNAESGYAECDDKQSFKFRISDTAKVFVIDGVEAALQLPKRKLQEGEEQIFPLCIDYETVAGSCDVLDVRISDAKDIGIRKALPGWDCDSVLILNKDVIEPLPVDDLDTSKEGSLSRAYGMLFRLVMKYLAFDGASDEIWRMLIEDSGLLSHEIADRKYEYFIRNLNVEFLSWKEWQTKHRIAAPDHQVIKKMMIQYWALLCHSLNDDIVPYRAFLKNWSDYPIAVSAVHHLIKFRRTIEPSERSTHG